ncbi:MAG TPA: hypothetical protein VGA13_02865 [Acidimicrobiales bacterium]|jgi:hypothetical protein
MFPTIGGVILAHQGGWDELLLVLAPIVVFAVLLMIANRRAQRTDAGTTDANPAGDEGAASPPDSAAV